MMTNYETLQHRDFEIQICYHHDAMNPFDDWDGLPSIQANGGRHNFEYSSGEDIADYIESKISYWQVIHHQKALCEILDIPHEDLAGYTADEKVDEIYSDISSSNMSQLAQLCEMFNIPHVHETQSYSRSNWADVLVVVTDTNIKEWGIHPKKAHENAESAARLFENWASGEVFGYVVEDKDGEELDSCWGFYGNEHEKSGLMEYATNAIDCHIHNKRKARFEKLKTLIAERVPHYLRTPILNTI